MLFSTKLVAVLVAAASIAPVLAAPYAHPSCPTRVIFFAK